MLLLKVCRAIGHDPLLSMQSIGHFISGGGSAVLVVVAVDFNNYSREVLFLEADTRG